MNEARQLLCQHSQWRIIDQTALGPSFEALQSFGIDDALCEAIGAGLSPATARIWVHHNTVVLGIQDTKLPFLQDGLNYLANRGYRAIVRNSGGLAVVLDEGVLNISLVFPERNRKIAINSGYDAMWYLIQQMFADSGHEIAAREIVGSYCPGSYDLSIDGKKFAGISQRRLKGGVAVQIYLCVTASGSKRAELIKEFYTRAQKGEFTKFSFPEVDPNVMASLSELLGPLSLNDAVFKFLQVLKSLDVALYSAPLSQNELPLYTHYYDRVQKRNEKALHDGG